MKRFIAFGLNYAKFHWQSLLSIALRMLGVALGFVVTYVIANRMGAQASGQYALVTQTATMGAIVIAGGLDLSVIRNFSANAAHGARPGRKSLLRILLRSFVFAAVAGTAVALWGLDAFGVDISGDAPYIAGAVFAVLLVTRALMQVFCGYLRSQRRYALAQTLETITTPITVCLCIAAGLITSLKTTLIVTSIGALLTAAIGIAACIRLTSNSADAHEVPLKDILKTARPLWGVAVSRSLGDWFGLAVVAALLSVHDAGIFRVASQIGLALSIVSVGILNVFAPQISAAFSAGDYQKIAQLTRSSSLLSTLIALPAAVIIFAFAHPLMAFIGSEFSDGARLVQIIVAGQALFVCTGTSGITLAMTGHERINLALTLASLASLLIFVPVAAQYGGLNWVGVVVCAVLVGRNIGSIIAVRKYLGIGMFSGRYTPLAHHDNEPASS